MSDGWWHKKLSYFREEVSEIDHEILELIGNRMNACLEIGKIKRLIGKPVFDPAQEKRVFEDKANIGAAIGLREDFVRRLMSLIMNYSKELQSQKRGVIENTADKKFQPRVMRTDCVPT